MTSSLRFDVVPGPAFLYRAQLALVGMARIRIAQATHCQACLDLTNSTLVSPTAQLGLDLLVPLTLRTLYFLTKRLPRQLTLPIRILFFGPVLSTDHSIISLMSLNTARYHWTALMPSAQFLSRSVRQRIPDDRFIPIQPISTPKSSGYWPWNDERETEYDHAKLAQVTSFPEVIVGWIEDYEGEARG
ncbi:hypothetical protein BCR44DRAFT_60740 [Catenaria anguillulae PL171]|uniref:Uncharacterized protein n=1 Tax=Catenaria anguillulae PL171 TaxID=765915 RepID=A0A1Y2HCG2_9FUNG|nr:hypothetical protein BCR44DRAFT_60740 [Catenaria anguillulae PL171]